MSCLKSFGSDFWLLKSFLEYLADFSLPPKKKKKKKDLSQWTVEFFELYDPSEM